MSSTANRVIKNTGYLYAKMGITMFVSLYTTRLILNSLGASDFGIFNIVGGAIAMLGFLNAAMASATQRFMSYSEGEGDKEKQKYIFNISLVIHFLTALLVIVVLVVAGFFFFNGILNIPADRMGAAEVVYGSLIVSTAFTVMTVPYDAVMNAHENMRYYAIVGIFESLLKLAVAFACVYTSGDKLIVYGILMACIPLATLTIMRVYCHRHYSECVISPRQYYNKGIMKEILSFSGWNMMGSIGGLIGNNLSFVVVNNFFGTIVNASIGIAGQLSGMLMVFANNMMKALNPVIVKKEGEGDHNKMIEYSYIGCKSSFFLVSLFCLPCIVEAPTILKLWLKNYPEWAILFVRFQLIRSMLEQLTITLGTSLNAAGKIRGMNIMTFIIDLAPIPILYFAFNNGASPVWFYPIIIFVMTFLGTLKTLYFCQKHCSLRIKDYLWRIGLPCLSQIALTLSLGYCIHIIMPKSYLRFSLCIIATMSTFTLLTYATLNKNEKNTLYRVYSNIKNKLQH